MKKHIIRAGLLILIIIVALSGYYVWKCIRLYEAKCILSRIMNEDNKANICLTIKRIPDGILYSTALGLEEMRESDSSNGIEVIVVDGENLAEHIYLFEDIKKAKLTPVKKESSYEHISLYYLLENKISGDSFEVAMFGVNRESLGGVYINGIEVNYDKCLVDVVNPYISQ